MKNDLKQTFTLQAEAVSAFVQSVSSFEEAVLYTLELCSGKNACEQLLAGCGESLTQEAASLCDPGLKTIAAPNLTQEQFQILDKSCNEKAIQAIMDNVRKYLGGIDIALTNIDYGIAETGTLVLNSNAEDLRISTMVCDYHIALLPESKIVCDSHALKEKLQNLNAIIDGTPATYTAFITGASRTADIERVLTLGVHGPLELHVLILEDNHEK